MSFWKNTPGPTWWDCIESLNPCIQPIYGVCRSNLQKQVSSTLPKTLHRASLSAKHASLLETFLQKHFTIYSRCRISLSTQRIRQGFLQDGWIGVGVFTIEKTLIGCCISKPLGNMKFPHETLQEGGVVDYFCVHKDYRKQGIAESMLNELVRLTAEKERLVHIFLKEGFPLVSLPPLYTGQYIVRQKKKLEKEQEQKGHFSSMGIGTNIPIKEYLHTDFLPLTKFAANLPSQLNGDSELFGFNYKGHDVFLCMTDLHHRTVPEGYIVGELSWMLPKTAEVPLSIQRLAVETCVDASKFDIVLLDSTIPHDKKAWRKDAAYSWYIFNYNPGSFFHVKPFWIF